MTSFRAKIISSDYPSIEPKQNESISRFVSPIIFTKESICDYNILIIRLEDVNDYYAAKTFNQEELNEFFSKPSIIICLSDEEHIYKQPFLVGLEPEAVSNYDWLPEIKDLKIVSKKGESLESTSEAGRFGNLFNTYQWQWKCSFSKLPPKYRPIAYNISGQSVALRADIGEGRVYIIPTPDININDHNKFSTFFRLLIDVCEEEIEELARRERKPPDWIRDHIDPLEFQLLDNAKAAYDQFHTLYEARGLLYEMSTRLTRIVYFVISKMGFNAEMKEKEGIQDIEICEDDFNLVIEVTSSEENWINIYKTRQLSDWCERFESEKGEKPKGILIANPYCDYPPTERGEPFTLDALKHAEGKGFCLMTTVDLYKMFCELLKGEIGKEEIKKLLLETVGLLKLEGISYGSIYHL